MIQKDLPRLTAAVLACALAACGGGGGGSGGGSTGLDSVNVDVDHTSISIIGVNGGATRSPAVKFTIAGGSGTYYADAKSDNDAFTYDFDQLSGTEALVTVHPAGNVAAGSRSSGHILYRLCTDAQCAHVAWSRSLPYTLTSYFVASTPLALSTTEGVALAPVTLAVIPADTDHDLVVGTSDASVLSADHTAADSIVVTPVTPTAAGSLSATVAIGYRNDGATWSPQSEIAVAVTVNSDIVAPAANPLTVTGTTSGGLSGQLPVSFVQGHDKAWTATSDRDWLVLDSASGTDAGNIAYHVDPAKLGAVTDWTSDTATIHIASPGLSTVSTTLRLDLQLPQVNFVTPSAVLPGRATTVHVTGRGLSQLAGVQAFSIGGVAPTGGSIDSDTRATLQLPALAASPAAVTATNRLAIATPGAALGVTAAGTFAAATLAHTGQYRAVVFDPTRNALFASDVGTDTSGSGSALVRYRLVGGAWQASEIALPKLGRLALSPDARKVYVTSDSQVLAIDPDTLQVLATYTAPAPVRNSAYFDFPLPLTTDLRLWVGGDVVNYLQYLDLRTGTFGNLSSADIQMGTSLYQPTLYGPSGGSGLFAASCTCASPTSPGAWYDASTGQMTQSAASPISSQDAFDAAGDLMLADGATLYRTDTFARVGSAPSTASYTVQGGTISPDGQRIYQAVSLGYMQPIDHLEVFDTATVAHLGTIALPDKATTCLTTGDYFCDGAGRLVVDPTGSTLFWLGEHGLVVVPIPAALSGVSSAPRAQAAATSRLRAAAHAGR